MLRRLKAEHGSRVRETFGAQCGEIDFGERVLNVHLRRGGTRRVAYDLLVGADGVNSQVRQQLVARGDVSVAHYVRPTRWKAMTLPRQPGLDPQLALRLADPKRGVLGGVRPVYPAGYSCVVMWSELSDNPWDAQTPAELRSRLAAKVPGLTSFDRAEVERFLARRPGREHHIMVSPAFHDHSGHVALLGDAAHGMYSALGQGLSCGLEGAVKLASSLASAGKDDVAAALAAYSQAAVPEAHAATQLSTTIGHSLFGSSKPAKLVAAALLPHGGLPFFRRVSDPSVPYTQLLRENRLLVWLARQVWRSERLPVEQQ